MSFSLIRNGTLIDRNGGAPAANTAVLIEDNRIQAVGPANHIPLPNADLAEIDAQGGFITNLRELGLMSHIGMTTMEAIVATTKTAAECLGWQDRVGTVEAGKLADIVITKMNPLADIRSLEKADNIAVVMKDGKIVKDRR